MLHCKKAKNFILSNVKVVSKVNRVVVRIRVIVLNFREHFKRKEEVNNSYLEEEVLNLIVKVWVFRNIQGFKQNVVILHGETIIKSIIEGNNKYKL